MFGGTSQRPLFRFRLAGIPVDVQPWFLLVTGVGALQLRSPALVLIWMGVVTVSVLWHELGHALAMRGFGYPPRIELHAMGGFAHWPAGASPAAREALVVTAAGPAAGLALGAAVWSVERAAGPFPYPASYAVRAALWVNVAWSLFNLLPMLPLDGGSLLDHVSRIVTGAIRPRWVGWASAVTGGAVVVLGVLFGTPYVALLGAMCAAHGIDRLRRTRARGAANDGLEAVRAEVRRATGRGDLARAVAALMPPARVGALPARDLAELVRLLVDLGRYDELVELCRDRLRAFARRADVEPLARFAADALADAGAHEHAVAVARVAFRQLNLPYHAYDAACHLVRLERPDEAVEWLGHALDAGLDCSGTLMSDPALEPLRARPDFAALAVRAGATKTG